MGNKIKSFDWRDVMRSEFGRLIVVIAAIALIIGVFFLVAFIKSIPTKDEKAILSAIANTLQQDDITIQASLARPMTSEKSEENGSFAIDGSIKLNTDSIQVDGVIVAGAQNYQINQKVNARAVDDKWYFKLPGATDTVKGLDDTYEEFKKIILPLAKKTDKHWVVADDFKEVEDDCSAELLKRIKTEKDAQKVFMTQIAQNKIITVQDRKDLSDGDIQYVLRYNPLSINTFIDDLKGTELFKSTKNCTDAYDFEVKDPEGEDPKMDFTATVDSENNRIIDVKYIVYEKNGTSEAMNIKGDISYDEVTINAPKESTVPIATISKEINDFAQFFRKQAATVPQQQNSTDLNMQLPQ